MDNNIIPYIEATCPKCGQELEVELPKGIIYQENLEGFLEANKKVAEHGENIQLNKAKLYISKIKHQIDIEISQSNIFNRRKKLRNIKEYVTIIESDYEKY